MRLRKAVLFKITIVFVNGLQSVVVLPAAAEAVTGTKALLKVNEEGCCSNLAAAF